MGIRSDGEAPIQRRCFPGDRKKEEEVLTKATAIDYCVLISLRWFLFPFYGIFYSQSYGESSIIKTVDCELFNGGAEEYA